MADRRIDQLTEAEDISDEDLFVIWKQNISQTRSIAKGTMNLASKSYVDETKVFDWSNKIPVSVQQIFDGYTCPVDGMFYVWGCINTSTSGKNQGLTVNGVRVAYMLGTTAGSTPETRPTQLTFPVSEGDVIAHTGTGIAVSNYIDPAIYLIPYKTIN